ncbi:MAG: hypothetical protein HOW97_04325, partial [Catenulispora sp.]|nr:hypothetical protein [Catenulispora sp.]
MTSTTAIPHNAYALLDAIDSLDRPARMRMVARTARGLAGTPQLAPLLAELAEGGTFERGLLLTMARITGSDAVLRSMLADPDFGLRVAALDAVIASPAFDTAVLATLQDAPAAWQRAVVRGIRRARRTDLADLLLLGTDAPPRLPEALLARLLPICSEPVIERLLPAYAHLPVDWKRLGTTHPLAVLDFVGRQLDELADGPQLSWWYKCADGVIAASATRPEQTLDLLERYPVWRRAAFPRRLFKHLGALADHDASRTLRLLVDAAIGAGSSGDSPLIVTDTATTRSWTRGPRMSRRVRRLLLLEAPAEALRWGTLYADDDKQIAVLLKTLPPAQRDAFFDAVTAGRDLGGALLAVELLDVLPHRRRHREALRMLALPVMDRELNRKLWVTARLPWAEGRDVLMEQTRAADAALRAFAYPLAIACAAAERDPAVFARFLDEDLTRIRNEQDPVRQAVLQALADASPALFGPRAVAALTRLGTDAVEVRDVSTGSLTALRQLARRILVHHAASGHDALLQWCLHVLEQVEGTNDAVDRERLDTLRHGQERAVVDVLTPWVRRGLDRAQHRRLLSLATALGRRAYGLPDVQAWLAETIWNSPSAVARAAIELWLADPAHRDERVGALVDWDPSVAKLPQVADVIARRRTDLLDRYLTGLAPGGRFMSENVRWFPQFAITAPANWLPRQRVQYAKLLARLAADAGATVSTRTDAIRRSARLGVPGQATVQRFLASGDVQLCEAALAASAWLPDPVSAIPTLLEHTDGDRARVAVYALTRAARYARPSELEQSLRSVLTSPTAKVTSRKEALRIAAQIGVPDLVGLLVQTWDSEGQHRHVRMAAVTRLVAQLDDPRVWPVLTAATAADRDVALELLRFAALEIPVRHRAGYGELVTRLCSHPDGPVRNTARQQVTAWYPWAPQAATAIESALLDTASNDRPPVPSVSALLAAGWPSDRYLDLIRRLMDVAAAETDAVDPATAFRDRPGRRRLEHLVTNLPWELRAALETWRPIVTATAKLLAADPTWLHEAARMQTKALDLIAAPDVLTTETRALADLTDGRPLAAQAASETLASRTTGQRADPLAPASLHAAASTLATDPRTSAGILAVALAAAAGPG